MLRNEILQQIIIQEENWATSCILSLHSSSTHSHAHAEKHSQAQTLNETESDGRKKEVWYGVISLQ